MPRRIRIDKDGDSAELQALFDSFAAAAPGKPQSAVKETRVEVVGGTAASADTPELEALFDSIVAQSGWTAEPQQAARPSCDGDHVFQRIGQMTRQLHDTLRELGYDRALEAAAKAMPDARQRLSYISQLTEQAASRVLNATDVAKPIVEGLQTRAEALGGRWEKLYAGGLSVNEFKVLAGDTREYLAEAPRRARETSQQLMEIMLAQDFQDLTGQVIKKVVELAQKMETELLQVLIETMPEAIKAETPAGLINGPVMNAEGRSDVVTCQEQVDDLLESLGF